VNPQLLSLLACPECRGPVEKDDDHVLRCPNCDRVFPVVDGIPRMLPAEMLRDDEARTRSHFQKEFTVHAEDDSVSDRLDEFYFASRTGIDPALHAGQFDTFAVHDAEVPSVDLSALNCKVVLDAGAGPGRFIRVAARHSQFVVALDLGDHLLEARAKCRGQDNVGFVQGSVLRPPLLKDTFDYVFSVGVLHHTPDPPGGARALSELVAEGGGMACWVYPPAYWAGPIRGPVARIIHRGLARLRTEHAWWVCSRILYPLGVAQETVARSPWLKLLLAPLFAVPVPRHPHRKIMKLTIFDYFAAPIISVHTPDEVMGWLAGAGFTNVRRGPVDSAVFGECRLSDGKPNS
jgi:uncharacterized protein YbaR (Trm112 family)